MNRTLIKNAMVVLPGQTSRASVLVEGSTIIDIGADCAADEVVDAGGLYLIPGVIDDQVHFREPGLTHKEDLAHATRACAKGGVTTFLEMPNTVPATITVDELHAKLLLAETSSLVNYGFYIGATATNLPDLKTATRTPGIKIFLGSSTGDLLVDEQDVLESIFAETSLPICAHCEDESTIRSNALRISSQQVADHSRVRDANAAITATKRALDLAVRHQHRFHVLHVSTGAEIPLICNARGVVTAEVCPHHLFFNVGDYDRLGALIKVNPSIKSVEDNHRLWQALLDGSIQIVATDHAPHTLEEKSLPYPACPSGMPSIENSLALMLNQVDQGLCSIEQVVQWMCLGPALIWDIVGKGKIEVGYDADLVLVDPKLKQTIRNSTQESKCRWSPWDGMTLTGWPVRTWVRGKEIFRLDHSGKPAIGTVPAGAEVRFDHSLGGYWKQAEMRSPI